MLLVASSPGEPDKTLVRGYAEREFHDDVMQEALRRIRTLFGCKHGLLDCHCSYQTKRDYKAFAAQID